MTPKRSARGCSFASRNAPASRQTIFRGLVSFFRSGCLTDHEFSCEGPVEAASQHRGPAPSLLFTTAGAGPRSTTSPNDVRGPSSAATRSWAAASQHESFIRSKYGDERVSSNASVGYSKLKTGMSSRRKYRQCPCLLVRLYERPANDFAVEHRHDVLDLVSVRITCTAGRAADYGGNSRRSNAQPGLLEYLPNDGNAR